MPADTNHDLSLPDWGPYTKKYLGISHIPEPTRGISFDLSLFPVFLDQQEGQQNHLPSVLQPAGVHPWEASTNLAFYTLRAELIWKDQFYCDTSYICMDERNRIIRMEFVNRTAQPRQLTLHSLAQLNYPQLHENTAEPIRLASASLPPDAVWVHALDYADLLFFHPRPTDNLVQEGAMRGEERLHDSVEGSVIGQHFGRDAGDTVRYSLALPSPMNDAVLLLRYLAAKGDKGTLSITGSVQANLQLAGTGEFTSVTVAVGSLAVGPLELTFTSAGNSNAKLNGFVLVEATRADQVKFAPAPWHRTPEIDDASVKGATLLSYADTANVYGIKMGMPLAGSRPHTWMQLDDVFGRSDDRTSARRIGSPANHDAGDPDCIFVHSASEPFRIAPHARSVIYGLVSTGNRQQVQQALQSFDPRSPAYDAAYSAARESAYRAVSTPAGRPYELSQQLLSAVTLSNVVYPTYVQRQYVRNYTPGRNWDSLYTWDDGFIGLGLLELDAQRAADILNAYTTPPGAQSAFILHGTPLPVQVYLFLELWNRTQSRELLEHFYPRLLQFHRFVAGRLGSSTTRRHKDHLICTWDYFYNTGGWDDYCPQVYIHANKLTSSAAPAVSSAHVIRSAKLLRQAAVALGRTEDLAEFDKDIADLSGSLQRYAWDEASGYFGYVMHDQDGNPTGILRHATGANFNMGLDGVSPLIAGICTEAQEAALIERVFSPHHLWCDAGITTIDRSAPYYSPNGYWNGTVWMAHQWWLWKTMLDLGRADLAVRIATTGLDTWKKSTDETYNCYEHFSVKTGVGDGWPQFSSLSSPVLAWFGSMYTPGRLTCGFDVWLQRCDFSQDNRLLDATLQTTEGHPGRQFSLLACMNPSSIYRATWNTKDFKIKTIHDGLLQIDLPCEAGTGVLHIEPA